MNLSAFKRIVGDSRELEGLVKAEALLADLVNSKRVPGIAITVLKKGKIVLQKGIGYADLEKKIAVDPSQTIFRIASVSKNIAATALAHMVADGQIDLDASYYKYVPYFPKKQWNFTIRQLAGHTAGIRGYRGAEYGLNASYSIKKSLAIFKNDDLLFEPGTDYLYNSYDWVLISLAMHEISGIPFEDYVQEKVLGPLGMEKTYKPEWHPGAVGIDTKATNLHPRARNDKALTKEAMATFYSKNHRGGFREAIPVNNFYKLAGGGYLSTSQDIANFGQAYLDGRVLNKEVLSQFLTSGTVNEMPTYYGLGWQVSEDRKGRRFYGHIGNGVGGYSNFFIYPDQQMVFAILINCTDPKVQLELDTLVDILLSTVRLDSLSSNKTV